MTTTLIKKISVLVVFIVWLTIPNLSAQNDCKVLLNSIDSIYDGSCRNGLAHGAGKAWGTDYYDGNFKSGLPHRFGIYIWSNGAKYEGNWKNGERHGKGVYTHNDTILEGRWRNDRFLREIRKERYQVIQRRNLERFTMTKMGEENGVLFEIYRSGLPYRRVMNLNIYGNSGDYTDVSDFLGFKNVIFPFRGKIDYRTPNKLGTIYYDVTFEFIINEPGNWHIRLHN
jgi:hypothetical protein